MYVELIPRGLSPRLEVLAHLLQLQLNKEPAGITNPAGQNIGFAYQAVCTSAEHVPKLHKAIKRAVVQGWW